jgi:predicted nucleic acid-binding protein
VLSRDVVTFIRVELDDFKAACRLYEQFADKAWNFRDCTSHVWMQRLSIPTAFSFDHHFRQFGFCTVVP